MNTWQKIMIVLPLSFVLVVATILGFTLVGAIMTPEANESGMVLAAMLGCVVAPFIFIASFALCWFFRSAILVIAVIDVIAVLIFTAALGKAMVRVHRLREQKRNIHTKAAFEVAESSRSTDKQEGVIANTVTPPLFTGRVDLTGEWAVRWHDPIRKQSEVFYAWITNTEDRLVGNAIDPSLRPAGVSGNTTSNRVVLTVHPWSGGVPSTVLPLTVFTGHMVASNGMAGTWRLRAQAARNHRGASTGGWTARKTADGPNRTVPLLIVTNGVVVVRLTEEQFDLVFDTFFRAPSEVMTLDQRRQWFLETKESRRAGENYEIMCRVSTLVDEVKFSPHRAASHPWSDVLRTFRETLHENGFPRVWGP